MKTNRTLKTALALAAITQSVYKNLNSPGTQNIRNPFPMRDLVLRVLPTMPLPVKAKSMQKFRMTALGKRVARNCHSYKLPKSHPPVGKSVAEIVADLQSAGFIANRNGVAMALSINRYGGNVVSVIDPKLRAGQRGRSSSRYFILS